MTKTIDNREYNYEILYTEDGVEKVISRAVTESEADQKLALALDFFDPPVRETVKKVSV